MATLRIYLDARSKKQDGTYPLRLAINHHGGTAFIALGVSLRREHWDSIAQRAVGTSARNSINDYLLDRLAVYSKAMREVMMSPTYNKRVTAARLRELIVNVVDPQENAPTTFKSVFDTFIATHENKRTQGLYEATWRKMQLFDKHAKKLTFEDINREWLDTFFTWMAKDSPSVNARNIHLRNIRSVFNFAIDDGITTLYPFRRVKIRPVETAKRSLSPEQLRMIFNADVEEWMQRYVDMFKLSFLLIGINAGDMLTLTADCISNGRLMYSRKKTHRLYSIKLEPEAAEIIKKYRGDKWLLCFCENNTSYRRTNQRMNEALQRIMPGVTSYYARHSWATIAASLDIPKETIAQALGHAQTSVTDVYIKFDRKKVDTANRRVIDYVLYKKQ